MSGGVDSSMTAFILKKKKHDVIGLFMRLGNDDYKAENAARNVCRHLGISFYPLNISHKFKTEIINYFISSYESGLTPNPCIQCNKIIKFGELLKKASEIGADYLATGHYAKIPVGKKYKLLRPNDKNKDQTYFLYNLNQTLLAKILFPLGDYLKEDIRQEAIKEKIPFLKKESQDVCFLKGDHNLFLKNKIDFKPGNIVLLENNKIIGKHLGLPHYTIGQRRGIELGGTGPYYAAKFDYDKNILYVSKERDDPIMCTKNFITKNNNWINDQKFPLKCEVVIRYRHNAVNCFVNQNKNGDLEVELEKAQRAVTPGQSAVFYSGDEVLGGGIVQ